MPGIHGSPVQTNHSSFLADGKASGRPRSALNTIIAAVNETNNYAIVTHNDLTFQVWKLSALFVKLAMSARSSLIPASG